MTKSHNCLKLYIMGTSERSERAISNLRRLCDEEIPSEYELVIIDVIEDPDSAERDKIFATPTLVKHLPPPARRIIGDLADRAQVIKVLNLQRTKQNTEGR